MWAASVKINQDPVKINIGVLNVFNFPVCCFGSFFQLEKLRESSSALEVEVKTANMKMAAMQQERPKTAKTVRMAATPVSATFLCKQINGLNYNLLLLDWLESCLE